MTRLPTHPPANPAGEVAEALSEEAKRALLPCATDRRCLLKLGLAKWSTKPGHRFPSIKLNSAGYAVRAHLITTQEETNDG